jgi:lipopolysaccharide heptosyltransferase II
VTSPAPAWAGARRLLCIRLDSLGDVLMTTPALRALKESAAGRTITLLTSASGAAVAALVPFVDDVIRYDAPWLKASASRMMSASDHAMIRILRCRDFDAAIVFTVFSQSALPAAMMCFLADIPLRLAHARENPYQLLSDWVQDPEPGAGIRHEVERQLALVAHVGCRPSSTRLILEVPHRSRQRAHRLLGELGIRDDGWAVIHPGATAPSRRYPPSSFVAAALSLRHRCGFRFLVTGNTDESRLVDELCTGIGEGAVGLAGVLDLGGLAAIIEAAPLLITNNSGPAHIAAAVGTPVVDLYALTNPQHTPWGVPSRVLSFDVPCRNCFKSVCPYGHNDCLRRIPPGAVVDAALELLSERSLPQVAEAAIPA